jgi:hypothetical protein
MVSKASKFLIEDAQISHPLCHGCKHWIKDSLKCAAFPHGIPLGIITNEWDHRHPIDGDHGIQYEATPD